MATTSSSRRRLAALGLVLTLAGAACAADSDTPDAAPPINNDPAAANATTTTPPPPTPAPAIVDTPDIVGTALRGIHFSQLAAMVLDAGLLDTLRSPGPFTVFAPNNAAFDKVPQEVIDAAHEDPELLKTVLTYHVVPGSLKLADLKEGELATVAGPPLQITRSGNDVMINGFKVAQGDLVASNGIVHVMTDVLMPPG